MEIKSEIGKEKIIKFKKRKYITLSKATRHIASLISEEFHETDLFQLIIDGDLKLSLFLTNARGWPCRIISKDEFDKNKSDFVDKDGVIKGYWWKEEFIHPLDTEGTSTPEHSQKDEKQGGEKNNICLLDDVHDLLMAGAGLLELRDMLNKAFCHENKQPNCGNPWNGYLGSPGVLVQNEKGQVYELMGAIPFPYTYIDDKNTEMQIGYDPNYNKYHPMLQLPLNEQSLVVRTSELLRLEKELDASELGEENQANQEKEKNDMAKVLDPSHHWYSKELAFAIKCWFALYADRGGTFVDNKPKEGHKKFIEVWLEKYKPKEWKASNSHFTAIINPDKTGGAPKT